MMMTIEPASFVPIYEQIKREIKSRISLGALRPNEPLPNAGCRHRDEDHR